tara:strand:+ start:64 stop:444 length:381 start_codon:yes stop_codon:yes gene_type:complete
MTTEEIQIIVDRVYPLIQKYYGKGKLNIPKIELHKDIYARISGIDGMEGEESHSSKAQYEGNDNIIYIYYPNMVNEEDVIRSIIHEYTHYKQDSELFQKYRDMYDYDEDPTEIEAHKNEEDWHLFI